MREKLRELKEEVRALRRIEKVAGLVRGKAVEAVGGECGWRKVGGK